MIGGTMKKITTLIIIAVFVAACTNVFSPSESNALGESDFQIEIIESDTPLYSDSKLDSEILVKLKKGDIFNIYDRIQDSSGIWIKVKTSTEKEGYVLFSDQDQMRYVKEISFDENLQVKQVTISTEKIKIHSALDKSSPVIFSLLRNEVVNVLDKKRVENDFCYYIELKNELNGYICSPIISSTLVENVAFHRQDNITNPEDFQIKISEPFLLILENQNLDSEVLGEVYHNETYIINQRTMDVINGGSWYKISTNTGITGFIFSKSYSGNLKNDPMLTTPVKFGSTRFELYIQQLLNKNTPLMQSDMLRLKNLLIEADYIKDVTGIEYALNLESLRIYGGRGNFFKMRGINGVSTLLKLSKVEMDFTSVDTSFLKLIPNIKHLSLIYAGEDSLYTSTRNLICTLGLESLTYWEDSSILKKCDTLLELNVANSYDGYYKDSDVRSWAEIKNLKKLTVRRTGLRDKHIDWLKDLQAKGIKINYN